MRSARGKSLALTLAVVLVALLPTTALGGREGDVTRGRCDHRLDNPVCKRVSKSPNPTPPVAAPGPEVDGFPDFDGELEIPATLAQDISGFNTNESYRITISCIDTEDVTCELNDGGSRLIASFDYIAHGMPYLYSEAQPGNHDHAWWVPGDREGYRCAYGFMYDKHPNPFGMFGDDPRPAEFISRFTIVRPEGQGYGKVNDAFMEEGQRYYDGKVALEAGSELSDPAEASDCQSEALDDFDYDSYAPQGPDQIRVGLFRGDGEIADIRDFTQTELNVSGHFEFIGLEDGRATIVFILGATNQVSHVFYYDTLNSGQIAVEVNGALIQDS